MVSIMFLLSLRGAHIEIKLVPPFIVLCYWIIILQNLY